MFQQNDGVFIMTLTIKKANFSDAGDYYCDATNTLGTYTQTIKVNFDTSVYISVFQELLIVVTGSELY